MSKNISSSVVRETVIGEAAHLTYCGSYVGYGVVHLDASTQSGRTTHRVGLRLTPDAAKTLVERLAKDLGMTVVKQETESVDS
jgi:hypothetical protein